MKPGDHRAGPAVNDSLPGTVTRFIPALQRLALTLWVGSLCTSGFLVAPLLFANLDDRALAGTLAGKLFSATAWVGLVCGLLLLAGYRLTGRSTGWRTWVVSVMLVVVVTGQFVLAPQIAGLREAGMAGSAQFGRLHGMASLLFMTTAVLGLLLVVAGPGQLAQSGDSR